MDSSLVTVIMPAYNAEKYIAKSIESVIQQTYSNWELIIIDDGSVDNTKNIIHRYKLRDKRIKYIWQKNSRQGKARNLGIKHSSGELISFLDADDVWDENKLEFQVDLLIRSKADLVFGSFFIFDEKRTLDNIKVEERWYYGEEAIKDFIIQNRVAILTVLCKKASILKVNGFSELSRIQNAEDYHLWIKLLCNGCKFLSHTSSLAYYRIHNNSVTSQDRKATIQVGNSLLDIAQHYPYWKDHIYTSITNSLINYLYHYSVSNSLQAKIISEQLFEIKKLKISSSLVTKAYQVLGDRIWRYLLLKYLWM